MPPDMAQSIISISVSRNTGLHYHWQEKESVSPANLTLIFLGQSVGFSLNGVDCILICI